MATRRVFEDGTEEGLESLNMSVHKEHVVKDHAHDGCDGLSLPAIAR